MLLWAALLSSINQQCTVYNHNYSSALNLPGDPQSSSILIKNGFPFWKLSLKYVWPEKKVFPYISLSSFPTIQQLFLIFSALYLIRPVFICQVRKLLLFHGLGGCTNQKLVTDFRCYLTLSFHFKGFWFRKDLWLYFKGQFKSRPKTHPFPMDFNTSYKKRPILVLHWIKISFGKSL